MLTVSILIGLRASLVVIYASLLFRVLFHWRPRADDQRINPHAVRLWWRWTWALFSLGMVLISLTRLVVIYPAWIKTEELIEIASNSVLASTTIIGLLCLNIAGSMAQSGFSINHGAPRWIVWPALTIPFWFIGLALGLRGVF